MTRLHLRGKSRMVLARMITTARIPTRSQREALEWSLVLISQGIESAVDYSDDLGWVLVVAEPEHGRAAATLRQYQRENRPTRWSWQQEISSPGILFDWGSLAWVTLISLFYWLSGQSGILRENGLMSSAAVSAGEWWRLFTAVLLHADMGHLATNAAFGFVLLGFVMGRMGTGIGLLAAFVAGAGGNVTTWLLFPENRSLGASGMVMACLGLLATQAAPAFSLHPRSLKMLITGLAGGAMLFALLGTNPNTDVTAHFGGFICGIALGALLLIGPPTQRRSSVNLLAGAGFALVVILTWWLAMNRSQGF